MNSHSSTRVARSLVLALSLATVIAAMTTGCGGAQSDKATPNRAAAPHESKVRTLVVQVAGMKKSKGGST